MWEDEEGMPDNVPARSRNHNPKPMRRAPRLLMFGAAVLIPALGPAAERQDIGDPVYKTGRTVPAARTGESAQPLATYDHGDPTGFEQLMLTLINRARADPGAEAARLGIGLNDGLDPGTISDTPKPPLSLEADLIASARTHSQWMLDTDTFDHTGSGGSEPGDRMAAAGYSFSGSWAWGENIAWKGTTGTPDLETFTRAIHDNLFESPGHRANLLSTQYHDIGIGLVTGRFTDSGSTYNTLMATQDYAKSADSPWPRILGAVYRDANGNGVFDAGEGLGSVAAATTGGAWQTATSGSGGFALPEAPAGGATLLEFSGAPLPAPVQLAAPHTGENVEIDLDIDRLEQMAFLEAAVSGGTWRATVRAHPHLRYELLYSTDLTTWTQVHTGIFPDGEASLSHTPPAPAPAHFYRFRSRR